jgi:hypothetical protein
MLLRKEDVPLRGFDVEMVWIGAVVQPVEPDSKPGFTSAKAFTGTKTSPEPGTVSITR